MKFLMNFIILGKNFITFGTFLKRFLKEKVDFESPILVLFDKIEKVGKASRDAYNQLG